MGEDQTQTVIARTFLPYFWEPRTNQAIRLSWGDIWSIELTAYAPNETPRKSVITTSGVVIGIFDETMIKEVETSLIRQGILLHSTSNIYIPNIIWPLSYEPVFSRAGWDNERHGMFITINEGTKAGILCLLQGRLEFHDEDTREKVLGWHWTLTDDDEIPGRLCSSPYSIPILIQNKSARSSP